MFLCAAWVLLAVASYPQDARQDEAWARWRFLIGDWIGVGSGDPGKGEGGFSFALDLEARVLVRKSFSQYPPKPGETKANRHEDLMIIYPSEEAAGFRAVYFDNEGHVIHYMASFPAKQPSVVFESEQKPGSPRYRLDYEMGTNGEVLITFAIAMPGQPYKVYLQGKSKRKSR